MDDQEFMIECMNDRFISRREFGAAGAAAAGVTAAAGASAANAATPKVVDEDVTIKTPDGTCDAAFVHPSSGSYPAVILWPDIVGLRPVKREMAARLAAEGYSVLVPNPFYRSAKSPVFGPDFDFAKTEDRNKAFEMRKPLTEAAVMRDATALVAWLDKQKPVNKKKKVGTVGYCMGGPMTMQTAAAVPHRVGAGVSCHGGGLVTKDPDSPHLLIPKMKAAYHFAVASNDDAREPDSKTTLMAACDAVKLPASLEVYAKAQHGWCVPGSAVYDKAQADRAWAVMLALYKSRLV
ncbi:MAG: dienelactone hydrolase family protein [Caulobacteraceae bacterium]